MKTDEGGVLSTPPSAFSGMPRIGVRDLDTVRDTGATLIP